MQHTNAKQCSIWIDSAFKNAGILLNKLSSLSHQTHTGCIRSCQKSRIYELKTQESHPKVVITSSQMLWAQSFRVGVESVRKQGGIRGYIDNICRKFGKSWFQLFSVMICFRQHVIEIQAGRLTCKQLQERNGSILI